MPLSLMPWVSRPVTFRTSDSMRLSLSAEGGVVSFAPACGGARNSMMFRGAFSTELYRALAEALHAEVRGGKDPGPAWELVHELRGAGHGQMAAV